MALRDQPYLPLYVRDFLTDEKLIECSAAATGVYVRLMCIMHKSAEYGKILLKQKDKQTDNHVENFCLKLALHMPWKFATILAGIKELLEENVIYIDGDFLCQKRMISDNIISIKRSISGKKGGLASAEHRKIEAHLAEPNALALAEAKFQPNTANAVAVSIVDKDKKEPLDPNTTAAAAAKKNGHEKPDQPDWSKVVTAAANAVWKDVGWVEQICMARSVTKPELKLWLANFNSSLSEPVEDFDVPRYKRMSRGWIQRQQAKGTKVEVGVKQPSVALTVISHIKPKQDGN